MFDRTCLRVLISLTLVLPFVGCSSSQIDSLAVSPSTQSLAAGATVQFSATATLGHAGHATKNVTNTVTWTSSDPSVATVSATGLATAVSAGTTNITASAKGFGGEVSASASLIVTGGSKGNVSSNYASITIIPGNQTVDSLQETGQFIAIGTASDGTQTDITTQVGWSSSDVKVGTVNASGLATGLNQGSTTIIAIATNPDGSVLTTTALFSEESSVSSGNQLSTLTVYKVGNSAGAGTITATDPNTGQKDVIDCGSGPGCTATFPLGSTVTLTEAPGSATFGGWSANCDSTPNKPNVTNTCVLQLNENNATVGAIFN